MLVVGWLLFLGALLGGAVTVRDRIRAAPLDTELVVAQEWCSVAGPNWSGARSEWPKPVPNDPLWGDLRFSQWLALLRDGNAGERKLAAESINQILRPQFNTLCCVVLDCNTGRYAGAEHAGIADVPYAIYHIVDALSDESPDVRHAAIRALAACGPFAEPAVGRLRDLLYHPEFRGSALSALIDLRSAAFPAVRDLMSLLDSEPDGPFKIEVAKALWCIGRNPRAMRYLGDKFIASVVAGGWKNFENPAELRMYLVSEILTETDRQIAGEALKLGVALKRLDGWWATRHACELIEALGPVAKEYVPELVHEFDERPGFSVLRALRAIGPDAAPAVPHIIAFYRSRMEPNGSIGDDPDAKLVMQTLGAIGAPHDDILALVRESLRSASPPRWMLGCELSGYLGPKASAIVPELVRLARFDPDGDFGRAACEAIAKIGPTAEDAVPGLIEILNSVNSFAAAEALGRIGPAAARAVPFLESKLIYSNWQVPAAVTLWRIDGRNSSIELLAARIGEGDTLAFAEAAKLGEGARQVIPSLRRAADDPTFCTMALDAWLQISPDAEVRSRLGQRMRSLNWFEAIEAAAMLARRTRDVEARRFLQRLAYRTNESAALHANRALDELIMSDLGKDSLAYDLWIRKLPLLPY